MSRQTFSLRNVQTENSRTMRRWMVEDLGEPEGGELVISEFPKRRSDELSLEVCVFDNPEYYERARDWAEANKILRRRFYRSTANDVEIHNPNAKGKS